MRVELLARDHCARHPDAELVPGPHLVTSGTKAIFFRTEDLEEATAHLEEEQVTFVWKIRTLSDDGLRSTMLRDPDGVLINVLSYPASS